MLERDTLLAEKAAWVRQRAELEASKGCPQNGADARSIADSKRACERAFAEGVAEGSSCSRKAGRRDGVGEVALRRAMG